MINGSAQRVSPEQTKTWGKVGELAPGEARVMRTGTHHLDLGPPRYEFGTGLDLPFGA